MRIAEYLKIVRTVHARTDDWRLGQTYFNVLTEARPELAEKVRGSMVDPFHNDAHIGEFLVFISDAWDDAA